MPKGFPRAKRVLDEFESTTLVPVGASHYPVPAGRHDVTPEPIPTGVAVRSKSGVQVDFMFEGERRTETLRGAPTVAFVRQCADKRQRVVQLISLGTFADEFPDSKCVREAAQREAAPAFPTVGEALREWLATRQSAVGPNTYKDYAKMVEGRLHAARVTKVLGQPQTEQPLLRDLRVNEVTDALLAAYRHQLRQQDGLSVKRVNNLFVPLRQAFDRLKSLGTLAGNPLDRLPPLKDHTAESVPDTTAGEESLDEVLPIEDVASFVRAEGEPDPFSPDEVRAVLAQLSGPTLNLFIFWLHTGLRTGELLGLRWSDIDWTNNRMYVRRSVSRGILKTTKTNKCRWVHLLEPARQALQTQFRLTGQARAWVFPNPFTGERYKSESKLNKRWKRAVAKARLAYGTPVRYRRQYQCRHTYASTMLSAGENPLFVAEQMGHADWSMLIRVYGRWIPQVDRELCQRVARQQGSHWAVLGQMLAEQQAVSADELAQEEALDDGDDDEAEAEGRDSVVELLDEAVSCADVHGGARGEGGQSMAALSFAMGDSGCDNRATVPDGAAAPLGKSRA